MKMCSHVHAKVGILPWLLEMKITIKNGIKKPYICIDLAIMFRLTHLRDTFKSCLS